MTAPVRIDASAWGDLRFVTLARLCGFADAEHALIKCAKIWSWQTEHYTDECPTYVVEVDIVESALGQDGAAHLVRARLAEEGPDGLRIRGSEGRIEWLWKNRSASKQGGEATKRKHANKERPHGQPVAMPQARPSARPEPGPIEGPLTLALSQDQISDTHTPRAHAIPRVAGYDGSPTAIAALVDSTFRAVSDARVAIAGELAITNVLPFPMRQNTPSESRGCRDLRERIREEGFIAPEVCRQVVAALAAEARETRTLDWLSEKAFTSGGWLHAREATPGHRKAPKKPAARAGLIGAATPRTDHGEDMKPAREVM